MRLERRRNGSTRAYAPVELRIIPGFSGSGDATITFFEGSDGIWYVIRPETMEEIKSLLSAVHVAHHNFKD